MYQTGLPVCHHLTVEVCSFISLTLHRPCASKWSHYLIFLLHTLFCMLISHRFHLLKTSSSVLKTKDLTFKVIKKTEAIRGDNFPVSTAQSVYFSMPTLPSVRLFMDRLLIFPGKAGIVTREPGSVSSYLSKELPPTIPLSPSCIVIFSNVRRNKVIFFFLKQKATRTLLSTSLLNPPDTFPSLYSQSFPAIPRYHLVLYQWHGSNLFTY